MYRSFHSNLIEFRLQTAGVTPIASESMDEECLNKVL